ncbi:MAG: GntR family transcriptional regulator [Leifsonia sp.]
MIIRIDPASSVPLFEQLASAVRSEIVAGRLGEGERLPAARELAASLDVNVHTVLHAYQALRDEGMLELRRGRGAVVAARPELGRVAEIVTVLGTEARRLSLAPDTVIALVREELAR